MKLNVGIVTDKLSESVTYYTEQLNFGITFQNEWYALLHTPDKSAEIAFLIPNLPTQHALFQPVFNGKGIFLTIEVKNVDKVYEEMKTKGIEIVQELKSEEWGDRHFSIVDPNGIGIDIVTYTAPGTAI